MSEPAADGPGAVAAPRRVRFLGSHRENPETTTFRFDLGDPAYGWTAGQNLVLTLEGVVDPRGDTRPFTVSSSPTEPGGLSITTKDGPSPFKQRLRALAAGDSARLEGPEGEFVLTPGRPAIFVAGGIGVTPFRSMLRFATDTRLEKPLVLVYSARTPELLLFRDEFDALARRNHAIRLLYTVTRPEESGGRWDGRVGRIDSVLLREAMRGIRHPLWYLAGPPALVRDDRRILQDELHVSDEDIRTDEFDGY